MKLVLSLGALALLRTLFVEKKDLTELLDTLMFTKNFLLEYLDLSLNFSLSMEKETRTKLTGSFGRFSVRRNMVTQATRTTMPSSLN